MSSPTPQTDSKNNMPGVLLAMLLIDSMHLIFARFFAELNLLPTTSSLYVMAVATLQVGIFLQVTGRLRWSVFAEHPLFFASLGLTVSMSTVMNYASVQFIDPGTASLLSRLSTVFGLAFGLIWLRERFSSIEWVGAVLCIAGAFVIAFQEGDIFRTGSLLVVAATLSYALHAAITKKYGDEIDFLNFFFFRVAATTFFLFLFTAPTGGLVNPSPYSWLLLVITGTVDVVISRVLYYWALRNMRLGMHSLILTVTPVITILWAYLFFGQLPTVQAIIGGAIVLSGIFAISVARVRKMAD